MTSAGNKRFVFLGPSLPLVEAQALFDAVYLPPVAQGDLVGVLRQEPRLIVVIDGYFQRVPSVWHKELLYALGQGVRIIGAASMGALRAVEMAPFGMEGVGTIYAWYRDGLLDADDEVAVAHGPAEAGYPLLSVPLVNIRATLTAARARGLLDDETERRLLMCARATYFPERSYQRLWQDAAAAGLVLDPRLGSFCDREGVDCKADDTRAALRFAAAIAQGKETVARRRKFVPVGAPPDAPAGALLGGFTGVPHNLPAGPPPASTTASFAWTVFWDELYHADATLNPAATPAVTPGLLHEYLRLSNGYSELRNAAAYARALDLLAQLLDIRCSEAAVDQAVAEFLREQRVTGPFGLRRWLADQRCTPADLRRLARRRVVARAIDALNGPAFESWLLDVLRERAMVPSLVARVQTLEQRWLDVDHPAVGDATNADLAAGVAACAARLGIAPENVDLAELTAQRGFSSVPALLRQVLKEREPVPDSKQTVRPRRPRCVRLTRKKKV